MKNKKRIIVFITIVIILSVSLFVFINYNGNKPYGYKWKIEENSVINQQRLYIVNKNDKPTSGYVRVTYLKGNSKKIKIEKDGKLFVKSVVKKIKVIK